jgi:hypothetical protein
MNAKPQDMTIAAFVLGRENLNRLRSGSFSDDGEEGENYFTRVGEQESVSYATGKGVKDTNPRNKSVPWTTFCVGIEAYASEVVGPTEADKKRSKYIIAGEVRKILHTDTDTRLGPVLSNREDVSVVSTTLLILDCDSPVAPHHRRERILHHPHGNARLIRDELIQSTDQTPTAGKDDSSLHDIRKQFRRRLFDHCLHIVHDDPDRAGQRVTDMISGNHHFLRKPAHEVSPPHRRRQRIPLRISIALL